MKLTTHSSEETIRFAAKFARILAGGDVVVLEGELGAGKTTFVKGVLGAFGFPKRRVVSPTFTIVKEYRNKRIVVYHIDLYRIERKEELMSLGYEEYFYSPRGVSLVEWGGRIEDITPRYIKVIMSIKGINKREIEVTTKGYNAGKISALSGK